MVQLLYPKINTWSRFLPRNICQSLQFHSLINGKNHEKSCSALLIFHLFGPKSNHLSYYNITKIISILEHGAWRDWLNWKKECNFFLIQTQECIEELKNMWLSFIWSKCCAKDFRISPFHSSIGDTISHAFHRARSGW